MEPELLEILKEAVETRQRKEDLDRSLGRALRRHNMGFGVYVRMTSELRALADEDSISIDDAARKLLAQR